MHVHNLCVVACVDVARMPACACAYPPVPLWLKPDCAMLRGLRFPSSASRAVHHLAQVGGSAHCPTIGSTLLRIWWLSSPCVQACGMRMRSVNRRASLGVFSCCLIVRGVCCCSICPRAPQAFVNATQPDAIGLHHRWGERRLRIIVFALVQSVTPHGCALRCVCVNLLRLFWHRGLVMWPSFVDMAGYKHGLYLASARLVGHIQRCWFLVCPVVRIAVLWDGHNCA